jgi:SAM-dependent MidA family methyltransferase
MVMHCPNSPRATQIAHSCGVNEIGGRIAASARRFGPVPWSAFMEAALYDPADGFYQAGGRAGRGGDFVTSPELGPLFAASVARALDRCWEELGRPDPFVVVEAAAGAGTLARDVLAAGPECSPALRYVLVERSAALRAAQAEVLAIELPALVLGPVAPDSDPDDDDARAVPGTGPLVASLAELPAGPLTGVVLANELLDNLAFDLLEWREGRWHEVLVAAAAPTGDELAELLVPAAPDVAAEAARLVANPGEGARIPLQGDAVEWLRQVLATVDAGRVILIDYADTTDALARRPSGDWLRTFRQHQVALSPLQSPGTQDITCVVAWDQLAAVRPPDDNRTQAEWLAGLGLDSLVEAARARWRERAAVGDLAALVARSRVHEAEALTDPGGLGGHRVLQWIID